MMVIWGSCYTTDFGQPPCGPWAEHAIDGLGILNLIAVVVYLIRSIGHPVRLILAFLMVVVEVAATATIWFFGGLSVSGFYF